MPNFFGAVCTSLLISKVYSCCSDEILVRSDVPLLIDSANFLWAHHNMASMVIPYHLDLQLLTTVMFISGVSRWCLWTCDHCPKSQSLRRRSQKASLLNISITTRNMLLRSQTSPIQPTLNTPSMLALMPSPESLP